MSNQILKDHNVIFCTFPQSTAFFAGRRFTITPGFKLQVQMVEFQGEPKEPIRDVDFLTEEADQVPVIHAIHRALIRREQTMTGNWVPACGGTETPFRARNGKTLLYCWNSTTGRHAYLDVTSDIILTDEEAFDAMN